MCSVTADHLNEQLRKSLNRIRLSIFIVNLSLSVDKPILANVNVVFLFRSKFNFD